MKAETCDQEHRTQSFATTRSPLEKQASRRGVVLEVQVFQRCFDNTLDTFHLPGLHHQQTTDFQRWCLCGWQWRAPCLQRRWRLLL